MFLWRRYEKLPEAFELTVCGGGTDTENGCQKCYKTGHTKKKDGTNLTPPQETQGKLRYNFAINL